MFRPTSPQLSMLEPSFQLPPAKRKRLEDSWAHDFRERILPLIDEEPLRDAFCKDNGRPNTSIRLLMGLSLLKEMFDLTDDEALAQLEFNVQWQYALAVATDEAHVAQRTLHAFRVRLTENERASKMFDSLIVAMVRQEKIRVNSQRLDSTHVKSNIATLTRLTLFTETITSFLRDLRSHLPAKLTPIIPQFLAQYLDREGYFSDVKQEEARRRLPMVAQHLADLVQHFKNDPEVNCRDTYKLLCRLLEDQCDVVEPEANSGEPTTDPAPDGPGEPPSGSATGTDTSPSTPGDAQQTPSSTTVKPKDAKQISGSSLQSPYDPDAAYGHKGKGYQAQLAETCDAGNPFQIVVGFTLNAANASDQHEVIPMLERLASNGLAPDRLFADQGYGSGRNIVEADARGVDLHAPVGGVPRASVAKDLVGLAAREDTATPVSATGLSPTGEPDTAGDVATPRPSPSNSTLPDEDSLSACENKNGAFGCAEGAAGARKTESAAQATRRRQREQTTPAFREAYKIRSGIESTTER